MIKMLNGRITSQFGKRPNPTGEGSQFHTGIDVVQSDRNVYCALGGKVYKTGFGAQEGHFVQIKTLIKGVKVYSNYFHNKANHVKMGDRVYDDFPIATQGSTGNSTGPHVHFELFIMDNQKDIPGYKELKRAAKYKRKGNRTFFNPLEFISYCKVKKWVS